MNSAYHRRVAFPSELGNSTSRQLHEHVTRVDYPGRFHRTAWTPPAAGHRHPDRHRRRSLRLLTGSLSRMNPNGCLRPPIGYGASGEHESFPGTVSIGTSALRLLLVEFGRSAAQLGVAPRLRQRTRRKRRGAGRRGGFASIRGPRRRLVLVYGAENADAHAGHTETSVLLHISPDDVWVDEWLPGNRAPLAELMPRDAPGAASPP